MNRALAGRIALGTTLLSMAVIEVFAASGSSVLVSRSGQVFPGWEAGPLNGLIGHPLGSNIVFDIGSSTLLGVMFIACVVAVRAADEIPARLVAGGILALHVLIVLGPPIALTDLFNYLGYARMGALHGLNPYRHGIAAVAQDPVYPFTTWHHLKSPYGPLFTLLSYPLGLIGLPAAYWLIKLGIAASSLGFLALVWRGAEMLGREPRRATLFVATNPLLVFYALAGFHNDFLMLVPATGAILLLVTRRDRAAGAVLMLAVAVKLSALLLLPFLLLGAGDLRRARRVLEGAVPAAVALAALSLIAFGPVLPNLSDQTTLLSDYSFPNVIGWLLGFGGGAKVVVRAANLGLVIAVVVLLGKLKGGREGWLESAGWATLALILTAAWLVPWYIVWLLPLAALGTSLRMRTVSLVLTLYLGITFMPAVPPLQRWLHIDPYSGGPGKASLAQQKRLSN